MDISFRVCCICVMCILSPHALSLSIWRARTNFSIIKMRAVSSGTPYSRDFFVVLDRLYDILTRTLVSWKKKKSGGIKAALMDRGGKKANAFWVERMIVAHDLGGALKYLHSLK